jgi:tetratricopeptide (TPR) repeat protein
MGFFNLRPRKLADDDLRDALFNAVAAQDTQEFANLFSIHWERVIALFPVWTTLPPSVRSDPARTQWWSEGMIRIASTAARLGETSLMARLVGPLEENVIILWQKAFAAAAADAASGNYASAIRNLEDALEKAEGLTGTGVDDLLPKTYGLLGTLNYQAGNRDRARAFTLKAKAYCERIGDRQGVDIYASNLSVIDGLAPRGSGGVH